MAKLLKTAALVVGAVALVATGIGAAAGAGLFGAAAAAGGSIAGIATAATFTTIGALAGVAASVLSLAAGASAPKGTVGGNQTKFTIDKDSGNPVAIGRTLSGGKVVHRQYHGAKNAFESWVTVHSIGPVKSVGPLLVDKVSQAFGGNGAAIGTFAGFMWLATQLGACPEASALPAFNGPVPGWDASSKLSGLAADMWCLKFDDKGKMFPSGVPERGRVVEGIGVYDPRLDSTFHGGSGPCRIDDPTTYILGSENPALHAITWAHGHWQNGTLIAGGGLDINGIDGQPFAEWASVCEANNWKVGGVVYTATDDSWDVLKMIAQAGGGEVMPVGALLSCTFSAPRVAIGTISTADITGDVNVPGTASRRLRRNTIIPRVRLEEQGWQVVPLDALTIEEYVTVDGGKRPKELDLPLVQQADQGAELGLYDILNGRELDGIVLPCKIYALGYRPGDCLAINIPEADLVDRAVVVRNRELDAASLSVTLTCRTETTEKHDFALGKTATPPRTPDLSVPSPINYGVDWDDVYGGGKPEDNATVGATIGENLFLPALPGIPVPPALILNSALELTPAGQLQYQNDLGDIVPIGALRLEDLGAASEASRRQLSGDLDAIATALQTALNEASRTRQVFTNAGITVDPTNGTVTISAVQQTEEALSKVSIRLSAAESLITLRATRTYVDNAIATAVLDPSQVPIFEGLEVRISAAEVTVDALTSAVTSKASNVTVDALGARVTTAESGIDALGGQISTKVNTTDFDALGARVSSAETTLEALGDSASIASVISVSRQLVNDTDATAKASLAGLLNGDLLGRTTGAAIATARQELTAKINDELSAEAAARVALGVRVGTAEAQSVTETKARIDAVAALATQISSLTATIGNTGAAVTTEAAARAAADGVLTAGLANNVAVSRILGSNTAAAAESALAALLTGDTAKRTAGDALGAAREEITAKINADVDVVVQRVTALLARIGASEASLVAEQAVRAAGDSALAQSVLALNAAVGGNAAAIASANVARVDGDTALSDRLDSMSARVGNAEAASTSETQARADGDTALSGRIDMLGASVGNNAAAIRDEASARADADTAFAGELHTLTSRVGNTESSISTEVAARTEADQALSGRIETLDAHVGDVSASVRTETQARVDADGAISARVDRLNSSLGATSASLINEAQARSDGDQALAAEVQTLSATTADHTASLTEQAEALSEVSGRVASYYALKLAADGTVTAIELMAEGGGTPISRIKFTSDKALFTGDVIVDGTLTADQIEADGITRTFSTTNTGAVTLSPDMTDTLSFPVLMSRPGTIMVSAVQVLVFAGGGAWATELAVDASILMTESGNVDHKSVLLGSFRADAPGTYTVYLRARRNAGAVSINAGGSVMLVHRTYA